MRAGSHERHHGRDAGGHGDRRMRVPVQAQTREDYRMSGLDRIGATSSQDMYVLLQQISRVQTGTTRAGQATASGSTSAVASGSTNTMESLRKAIEEAVAKALGSLDKNSSAETVMNTLKSAVDGAMKAAGIEPPRPPDGARGPGGPGAAGGPGNDFMSLLDQLLQENGFDPEKIKEELQSQESGAMQTAGTSSVTLNLLMYLPATGGVDTEV
jgi:hypothetical protein